MRYLLDKLPTHSVLLHCTKYGYPTKLYICIYTHRREQHSVLSRVLLFRKLREFLMNEKLCRYILVCTWDGGRMPGLLTDEINLGEIMKGVIAISFCFVVSLFAYYLVAKL